MCARVHIRMSERVFTSLCVCVARACSGTSSWDGEGADPGTQGRSRADYVAADAAADVGDRWLRQTSSLLHSGGHNNVEKEEVNSGA